MDRELCGTRMKQSLAMIMVSLSEVESHWKRRVLMIWAFLVYSLVRIPVLIFWTLCSFVVQYLINIRNLSATLKPFWYTHDCLPPIPDCDHSS